ncbi:MAG TPA: Uma2 family endonuclease [Egibacteraceae bacterium]|jgi:Uma2 family endonuclease|nr:Uma2 family endonuclease [Egibacteraceae bacterium]
MAVDELEGGPRIRPLYRREYEALAAQGFFADEDVELLDGRLVLAAEEGPSHAAINSRLTRILVEGVPATEGDVRVGSPLAISDLSLPHPDFAVVEPTGGYRVAHPTTASLVIEVAHSSRRTDLGLKAALYAAAGLADYWVVDLGRDEVVVHREPAGTSFASVTRHREGVVHALHHTGVAVDVAQLLR